MTTASMDLSLPALDARKFQDPDITANGDIRAKVALHALETLWFNTGTLCNLSCGSCYIESTPRNDRLAYLTRSDVRDYLNEISRCGLPTRLIGFTGGEPFMNPDMLLMLEDCLVQGMDALVLTNAMKPMQNKREQLLSLRARFGDRMRIRVSLDHYGQAIHEAERGAGSWAPAIEGLTWLAANGFTVDVASRYLSSQSEAELRDGFARLFQGIGVELDASDPISLMLFPQLDPTRDAPEITEACWGVLNVSPEAMMCSSARMVVKRKGEAAPAVVACTLLPYDRRFELGQTLAEASGAVALNHPHCATFCVLGGAACSR